MQNRILVLVLVLSSFFIDNSNIIAQSIQIDFDNKNQPYLTHSIEKGAGLYSIARKYLVSLEDIYLYNALTPTVSLKEGQLVKIPIDLKILFTGINLKGYKYGTFTPVYYQLKPKETLYRIAKTFCNQEIEIFAKRNKLLSIDLAIGTNLLIGWFPEDTYEPILHVSLDQIDSTDVIFNDSVINQLVLEEKILISKRGVAYWDKNSSLKLKKFALHKTAKINSEIELYNPLVRRSTKAKVIGRIPEDTYASNVSIIVSPATAASLGALDSRFMVELKYEE